MALTFGKALDRGKRRSRQLFEPTTKIEWRGASAGDPQPVSAIVRYRVGQSVGRLSETRLAVYHIEPSGRSGVMAVAREPDANRKARRPRRLGLSLGIEAARRVAAHQHRPRSS